MSDEHPRILIVKLSSFGDVLHALPTLEALRDLYPQGRLTWLVEAAYAPLLAEAPGPGRSLAGAAAAPGADFHRRQPGPLTGLVRHLRAQPLRCGHRPAGVAEERRVGGPGPKCPQGGL